MSSMCVWHTYIYRRSAPFLIQYASIRFVQYLMLRVMCTRGISTISVCLCMRFSGIQNTHTHRRMHLFELDEHRRRRRIASHGLCQSQANAHTNILMRQFDVFMFIIYTRLLYYSCAWCMLMLGVCVRSSYVWCFSCASYIAASDTYECASKGMECRTGETV